MLKIFYPYEYEESIFSIDYNKLYRMGYRGIIFDIDNTLVPHGDASTKEVDEFFRYIQAMGFKTLLLSNNDEPRIKKFLENIDSPYICDAEKPNPKSFIRAIHMLGLKKEEVVLIGDQIFTDILGANRSGIANILVKFIGHDRETKPGFRRTVERGILFLYKHRKSCTHRLGGITKQEA